MKKIKDVETYNLYEATLYSIEYLKSYKDKNKLRLQRGFILQTHKILLQHIPKYAGRYRTATDNIKINGTFKPSDSWKVDHEMNELIEFINNKRKWYPVFKREILKKIPSNTFNKEEKNFLYKIFIAWFIHHRFVCIHPFCDGNGRMARIIMCLIIRNNGLAKNSFPPLVNYIINKDKCAYLDSLNNSDSKNYIKSLNYIVGVLTDAYKESVKLDEK